MPSEKEEIAKAAEFIQALKRDDKNRTVTVHLTDRELEMLEEIAACYHESRHSALRRTLEYMYNDQ